VPAVLTFTACGATLKPWLYMHVTCRLGRL
jgi:hypothetical protein